MHPAVTVIGMGRNLRQTPLMVLSNWEGWWPQYPPPSSPSLPPSLPSNMHLLSFHSFYSLPDIHTVFLSPHWLSFSHLCLNLSSISTSSLLPLLFTSGYSALALFFLCHGTPLFLFVLSISASFSWFPHDTSLCCSLLFVFLFMLPSAH